MYHCKRFADRSELWIECMLLFLFLTNIHYVECSSQFWERRKCECNLSSALTALERRGLIGGRPITIQKLIANPIHYNSKSTLQVDLVLFITGSKGGIYSSFMTNFPSRSIYLVSFAFCQQDIKSYPGAGAVSDLNNERGLYIIIWLSVFPLLLLTQTRSGSSRFITCNPHTHLQIRYLSSLSGEETVYIISIGSTGSAQFIWGH